MDRYMTHYSNPFSIFLRVALTFEKMTVYLLKFINAWQNALRKSIIYI